MDNTETWSNPAGYSHAARTGAGKERDVLREMLSTLEKPEYADVLQTVLCPNLTPMLDDFARQTLFAIFSRPACWKYFRPEHLRNALHELAAPWIAEEKWGGKVIKWLDENPVALPFRFLRQPFIRVLLRLGGAQVGRMVRFGRKVRIRELWGLRIADNLTTGEGVSICAMHPCCTSDLASVAKSVSGWNRRIPASTWGALLSREIKELMGTEEDIYGR